MSSLKFELEAEVRHDVGKGASRRLRHADSIPAIVYGAGKEPLSLTLNHEKISLALAHEAFYSHILTLKVGKNHEKVILKDIQRHPSKPRIQHIDFLRIKADQKLKMNVPLHFVGEEKAPGIKKGGIFTHSITDLEISCLPDHLPEFIEVDVSTLELDQALHLSELKLPKGVEIVALSHGVEGHDQAVISLHIPRIIEEPIEIAAAEEVSAEAEKSETTSNDGDKKE